jgi:hypothetical protein
MAVAADRMRDPESTAPAPTAFGLQYVWGGPTRTIGPVVWAHAWTYSRSPPPGFSGVPRIVTIIRGPTKMTKDLFSRTRRLALTVGPLVAIALSLAAGWKW